MDPIGSHIPRGVRRQCCRWHGDANLIVKKARKLGIPHHDAEPFHTRLATVKVQVGNMKESMNLFDLEFASQTTPITLCRQVAILQVNFANHLAKGVVKQLSPLTSLRKTLRKVIKQNR